MSTKRGLLANPNAASQAVASPGVVNQVQQAQPMQTTTATNPATNIPPPGQAGTGGGTGGGNGQQVVPKPGDRALDVGNLQDSMQEYEEAFNFDPNTMTVEGRMAGLMEPGNAYVERARQRSSRESASRGLRNSSIAVQAGEEAAYEAAMPIATADAELAMQVRRDVFGAAVEDRMQIRQHGFDLEKIDVEYNNNRGLADQAFGFNTQLAEQSYGHNRGLQSQQHGFAMAQGAQDIAGRKDIAGMEISARAKEAALGREYGTSEREATQGFTAGESQLERDSRIEMAQTELNARAEEAGLDRDSRELIATNGVNTDMQLAYTRAVSDLITADAATAAQMSANGKKGARAAEQYMEGQAARLAALTKLFENSGIGSNTGHATQLPGAFG